MADREQRFIFGEVAETYHRVRPGYPLAAIEAVAMAAPTLERAVEIGAGTGKATELLAPLCGHLTALEPSERMAAVAASTCARFGNVEIVGETFEAWRPPADHQGSIGAIVAAQAWHWVDATAGIPKAHALLGPGGVLALLWNRPIPEATTAHERITAVYDEVAPDVGRLAPWQRTTQADMKALRTAPGFELLPLEEFPHEVTYSTEEYLDLMRTQSNHRLIEPDRLQRLLEGIATVATGAGGRITVPYMTMVTLARRVA